jgi:hypothetical protein
VAGLSEGGGAGCASHSSCGEWSQEFSGDGTATLNEFAAALNKSLADPNFPLSPKQQRGAHGDGKSGNGGGGGGGDDQDSPTMRTLKSTSTMGSTMSSGEVDEDEAFLKRGAGLNLFKHPSSSLSPTAHNTTNPILGSGNGDGLHSFGESGGVGVGAGPDASTGDGGESNASFEAHLVAAWAKIISFISSSTNGKRNADRLTRLFRAPGNLRFFFYVMLYGCGGRRLH